MPCKVIPGVQDRGRNTGRFCFMVIDIINQENPFIMVPKKALKDRALSATEKGLYAMLYSVLPRRKYTIEELSIAVGLSEYATRKALSNLSLFGYLRSSEEGNGWIC